MQNIKKIFWITVAWTIISVMMFLRTYNVIRDLELETPLSPLFYLLTSIYTGAIAGVLGGTLLVFGWEKWLRSRPYGWTIRNFFITYTIVFFLVAIFSSIPFQMELYDYSLIDSGLWVKALKYIGQPRLLIPYVFWLVISVMTLIAFLVNDKYGPGVFKKFLLGKYFNPTREERIFMFLDLKSSTTIAEELGERKYFNFIKDVFKEITPSILNNKGEIYQYVGDEVVISWSIKEGIENHNCINCFFDIKSQLKKLDGNFQKVYQISPILKAGLHFGNVMAGEVGVVKRDIAYSGDVLNTASRIQNKCNELKEDILLSSQLYQLFQKKSGSFSFNEIGEINLKGKKEKVNIFTVENINHSA